MHRAKSRPQTDVIKIESSESEELDAESDEELHEYIKPAKPTIPRKRRAPSSAAGSSTSSVSPVQTWQNRQWIDKYEPTTSDQICINPQKLNAVKKSLGAMINGTSSTRLLVLTGPAGSSKSTTIKVLANEMARKVHHLSLDGAISDQGWIEYIDTGGVLGVPQPLQFDQFMSDARYKVGSSRAVVIIEELPNVFHEQTLLSFRDTLWKWLCTSDDIQLPPLVLCLTEVEYNGDSAKQYSYNLDNNLCAETLLGKPMLNHPAVEHIKFNPIAARYLKKTISRVVSCEKQAFSKFSQTTVNQFVDSLIKIGDIRSIIFNLELWSSQINRPKEESTNKDDLIDASKLLGLNYQRENQINLFHAIGKILYSSSEFEHMDAGASDYYSVEKVLSTFNSNNFSLLNLSILENYHIYRDSNYSLETAGNIADDLSICDTLDKFDVSRDIGIRSARNHLRLVSHQPAPPKSRNFNNKIKFPRHFKMVRQYNNTHKQVRNYQKYIDKLHNSFHDLNMIHGHYMPLIYNKKYPQRYRYNRLGGRFLEIYADEDLPVVEEGEEEEHGDRVGQMDQFQIEISARINESSQMEDYRSEDEELSDPIDDTENDTDDDGFSSDDELDVLISQGRL